MKKKILPLLLLFISWHVAHAVSQDDAERAVVDAQESQPDTYVPLIENYPSFMVELLRMDYLYSLGSEQVPFHNMKKFDLYGLLRGNGAILYAIRINQSRFAFCIGPGWSTLYYAARGKKGASGEMGYSMLKRKSADRTEYEDVNQDQDQDIKVLRSTIKIPFIDFLFRLRFNSVLEDPKAGFHTWLGFKIGMRRRASATIKYHEYDDVGASSVQNGYFNLNSYAFGLQAGIGYERFGLTGGFHLTPLFKKNQGPRNTDRLRPFSFGIYVDLI